jgi:hypothetical protein
MRFTSAPAFVSFLAVEYHQVQVGINGQLAFNQSRGLDVP